MKKHVAGFLNQVIFNNLLYCLAQCIGGFLQILSALTKAQTFSSELFTQVSGLRCRQT